MTILVDTEIKCFKLDAAGRVTHVVAGNGLKVLTDVIIVGIGLLPNVELAAKTGITIDENGQSSAAFPNTVANHDTVSVACPS